MEVKLVVPGLVVSMLFFVNAQACMTLQPNETKGEITTPGYPHRLGFNKTCYFLKVENGLRLKVTLENVSLPNGTCISADLLDYIYTVGTQELQSKVFYSKSRYFLIVVTLRLNNTLVVRSEYRGMKIVYEKISKEVCRYTYQTQDITSLRSPNFPKNYDPNMHCEYFIESSVGKRVFIAVHEFSLSPSDDITFYDGSDNSILTSYNGTRKLVKSVTSKSMSVRVVFRSGNETGAKRTRYFLLKYREIEKGVCLEKYVAIAGQLSSANKSCTYVIKSPLLKLELKFKDLLIPPNDRIAVTMVPLLDPREVLYLIPSDSGQVKYIVSKKIAYTFEIKFNSSTKFYLKFKKFKKDSTVNLKGTTGTLKSPYYPQTYTIAQRSVTYRLEVPDGHVKLNFTELTLSNNDFVKVHDGFGTSGELLGDYRNQSIHGLPVVLSSGNRLTVVFYAFSSYEKGALFRFLAVFTRETKVLYCNSLKVPNGYAARNVTLQGWSTRYYCNAGYHEKGGNHHWPGVDRVCNFNGEWEPGKGPNCLRICQPLSPTLKLNSSLVWFKSSFITYDGEKLTFICDSYLEEILIGPREITCTSHGNYSALPPTCKKRKEKKPKDNNNSSSKGVKPWIIGAGVGGALFICVLAVAALRIYCGCFLCFSTSDENGGHDEELHQLEDEKKGNVEETHI